MTEPLSIALIYGSDREGRICDTVAEWAIGRIEAEGGIALDVIDPLRLPLPDRHPGSPPPMVVRSLRERIGRADGVIVVTAEYNHSFTGALKSTVDLVSAEWHAKPVAFVSYGGISGGLRAVEALRLVFAELHAVTVRDGVSFAMVHSAFDDDGTLKEPGPKEEALALMLKKLTWWARALKAAGGAESYDAAR